ncbi:YcgL domain-containing protein [Enterobacteriaceae bacterium ESL0689]|nr:YcgL domain-containing protein [Enterobacteriaceae bacterium ESL0689]
MFCVIYRSPKRENTYLYVSKKDDFSRVPAPLMAHFGQPQITLVLSLDGRKKLVGADLEKVKQALTEQGYYLQLPPAPENLLKQHLAQQRHHYTQPRGGKK